MNDRAETAAVSKKTAGEWLNSRTITKEKVGKKIN